MLGLRSLWKLVVAISSKKKLRNTSAFPAFSISEPWEVRFQFFVVQVCACMKKNWIQWIDLQGAKFCIPLYIQTCTGSWWSIWSAVSESKIAIASNVISVCNRGESYTDHRAVFKWLSKNKNQLFQPITTGTNSTINQSQSLAIISNSLKARENHAYLVRLVLVLILIGWKTGASLFGQSLRMTILIA